MTTLEKIEWVQKHKVSLEQIFSEPVLDGILTNLWNDFNQEEKDMKDDDESRMTDEQVEFNRQAILNK